MKRYRYLLFVLLLLAGFSIALTSIKGQQQPQTPSVAVSGTEVPGPVSDELAQEAFLRILINSQNGADNDWKMRSSYLRWAGFTNDQIETIKPLIEGFKTNIDDLDKQSLALSAEDFASPNQFRKDQITAIERDKKDLIASTYIGISQLVDSARLRGHLDLKIKPRTKHFVSKPDNDNKKIGLFDNLFRRHFTVNAQPPGGGGSPCTVSGSVTNNTWIDYSGLMAYSTGSTVSYYNSCGHSGWTETKILHNGLPLTTPPTYYWPLDPGGSLPLEGGDFTGTTIGYSYCTMIAHLMGWAGAGSGATVVPMCAVTRLVPGNGSVQPGTTMDFRADVKCNEGAHGNVGVRFGIDSNPSGLTFDPIQMEETKDVNPAAVFSWTPKHTNSNVHGSVIFYAGIQSVPSGGVAGGTTQTNTICFGTIVGGLCQ